MKINFLLIFTIIIYLFTSKSYAQDNGYELIHQDLPFNENDSLYIKLIENYIFERERKPHKYIPQNKSEKILYIEMEDWINNLPTCIMDYKIVFLTPKNKYHHYKINNNQIVSLSLSPLSIKNKIFTVGMNEYYSKIVKKKIEYLRIGISTIDYYKYELGKLVYLETTYEGTL